MLINAVPYVANITGTFGAYLKFWDKRTYNPLTLTKPQIIETEKKVWCYNRDYKEMLDIKADLLYADPPYNSREYLPNYHVLETIARYDNPTVKGVTGIRPYEEQKSGFCRKNKVAESFDALIKNANARYILISYNNEGLIGTKELTEICQKYARAGTFRLVETDYRRYKNKIPNNAEGLKEQLYFLEKEGKND
jgi:adenine-specific DNA-methyltransferase